MHNSFGELIGYDVEFLPGIEQFGEYLEAGMKATILHVSKYPEEGVYEVYFSYMKFEDYNRAFETARFTANSVFMTHRDLVGYESLESFCVTREFNFFKQIAQTTFISEKIH